MHNNLCWNLTVRFHYMAVADNRQRYMPHPDDRLPGRGEQLAYPEAVRLVDRSTNGYMNFCLLSLLIHNY